MSFKPLLIHIIITIISGILFGFLAGIDLFMNIHAIRKIIYVFECIIVIGLYLFSGRKFLKDLSKNQMIRSVSILFVINITLGLTGYLMINQSSGLTGENGQFPLILLSLLNIGFMPFITLSPLPEIMNIIILCVSSPLVLVLSRQTNPQNYAYQNN